MERNLDRKHERSGHPAAPLVFPEPCRPARNIIMSRSRILDAVLGGDVHAVLEHPRDRAIPVLRQVNGPFHLGRGEIASH